MIMENYISTSKKDVLKLGYFADGKWAHESFLKLIKDDTLSIQFICVRYDTTDQVLKKYCDEYHLPYLQYKNINSQEFIDLVKNYNCDLFVSMSFNQIFKKKILAIPRMGTINCHAGKLPFYRGRNVLNWVLINDEKEFGITVHFIDEGIDTGDIILQKTYPISDMDDYSTLLDRAYLECASCLYDSIKLIQDNKNLKLIEQNQIHTIGFYCGMRVPGDEIINWNQSSRDVFNFIRSICKPGPMARTHLNGNEMKINKAKLIDNAPQYKGIPGQIVGIYGCEFVVKTLDSTLLVIEYDYEEKVRLGDRLK